MFCVQVVVPLERNGQTIELLQRKFHVTIPFAYSTSGYGFLFNMPGYGHVSVGQNSHLNPNTNVDANPNCVFKGGMGTGGMLWKADASLALDLWITASPATSQSPGGSAAAIYEQYADATGHSPMLREDAMIFWQSRNRYKSSAIALDIASRYQALQLPVGHQH